jgi:diguanylate cyclase (GGDEF)-like protein/PAS domain S-box-containing protein
VTDQRLQYDAAAEGGAEFEVLFQDAPVGYLLTGTDGRILRANNTIARWLGEDQESLTGRNFMRLLPVGDRIMFGTHAIAQLDRTGALHELSTDLFARDRTRIPVLLAITRVQDPGGTTDRIVITRAAERRVYEQELVSALRNLQQADEARNRLLDEARRQASHDALTGLANRSLLQERIQDALIVGAGSSTQVGLLFGDVNRFKRINDNLGHAAGDDVLRHVAACLDQAAGAEALVARYSGDAFVVLVPTIVRGNELSLIENRLRAALALPVLIGQRTIVVDVAVGTALTPLEYRRDDVTDIAERLVEEADAAMYRAKTRAQGAPMERSKSPEKLRLETDLRGAAARGELRVFYQPQVDAVSGRLVGAEALVRWQHPELGLLAPMDFIEVAEDSGLITEVGAHVLEAACAFGKTLLDDGTTMEISVNVSAQQLTDPGFPTRVIDTLEAIAFPARLLTLEVTESKVISNSVHNDGILEELRDHGIGISVDDFGTGYSSLSQLHRMPVTEVKIDRSFV